MADAKRTAVSEYYAELVSDQKPKLQTDCACAPATDPHVRTALGMIHEDILSHYFGCASPIPPSFTLKGRTVLDMGCGTGKDVYVCSSMVGPEGLVIGVDMTEKSLDIARKYEDFQMKEFGFDKSNVVFHHGSIEDLKIFGIEDNSVDVVISNCVINLTPDKEIVLREIFRILRPGGELYFSDMYCDRKVPAGLSEDLKAWGECLSGALSFSEFKTVMDRVGFTDYRIVDQRETKIQNAELKEKAGGARWFSRTIRAFKINGFDPSWMDYGQTATFISESADYFKVDDSLKLYKNRSTHVDGNTALMLTDSRYSDFFSVTPRGEKKGKFDMGEYLLMEAEVQAEMAKATPCCGGAKKATPCCGGAKKATPCCGGDKAAPAAKPTPCCGGVKATPCCGGASQKDELD